MIERCDYCCNRVCEQLEWDKVLRTETDNKWEFQYYAFFYINECELRINKLTNKNYES